MTANPMDSQLKRNIRLTVISGAVATIVFNLTGPFTSLFVLRLGGSDYHVAWLSSLPALAAMFALIPGGVLVDRFTYKKNITCFLIGANRFFYLCLALVPFLPPAWRAAAFVLIIGIMKLPGAISEIAWQSFYADIVPDQHRGFAMAQRSRISTIVGMIITLTAGQILSFFPQTDQQRVVFYQAFFVLAFAFACYEVYTNMKISEPRNETNEQESATLNNTSLVQRFRLLYHSFHETPQAKRFLIFAVCSTIFHFGWQMGWPLFSLYQIKYLNAGENWLAIVSVISALTSALSYTQWSRFAQKRGNDITLAITGMGMVLTPLLYASSKSMAILALVNTVVGVATAGFTLTLANITLIEVPKFQRTLYIACYTTLINISAVFAPSFGVFISENWGIHVALYTDSFLRFLGVIAFYIRYRYHAKEKMQEQIIVEESLDV